MLVKVVGCILLISVYCCGVAWSQSLSESCTNRSIEYADCISKAERSSTAICKDTSCFGPVLFYYRDCLQNPSRARQLQEDCTQNIYGRLCSQIVYSLPFECSIGGCDDECGDVLRRRYGCCARSSFATTLQSIAPFCSLIFPCPLPSSGRAEVYDTMILIIALVFATAASIFST